MEGMWHYAIWHMCRGEFPCKIWKFTPLGLFNHLGCFRLVHEHRLYCKYNSSSDYMTHFHSLDISSSLSVHWLLKVVCLESLHQLLCGINFNLSYIIYDYDCYGLYLCSDLDVFFNRQEVHTAVWWPQHWGQQWGLYTFCCMARMQAANSRQT